MGLVALKSSQITNRDASPVVLSNPIVKDGMVRSSVAKISMGSADSGSSTYRFCSIPSNARIVGMSLSTDTTAGGSCAIKLGLYDTTANAGAIVGSGDQFGTAIDLHTAALTKSNQVFHSGASALTPANAEKAIWDSLALSSDPNKEYDIVATLTADNSSNAVVMVLQVDYVL